LSNGHHRDSKCNSQAQQRAFHTRNIESRFVTLLGICSLLNIRDPAPSSESGVILTGTNHPKNERVKIHETTKTHRVRRDKVSGGEGVAGGN
jgi:hypothetical protein